jgi:hypothetical protein
MHRKQNVNGHILMNFKNFRLFIKIISEICIEYMHVTKNKAHSEKNFSRTHMCLIMAVYG